MWGGARMWAAVGRAGVRSFSVSVPVSAKPFNKVMVANRGEIAIRVFRGAKELGCKTVAVYSQEDMRALHRAKADEAYMIGAGLSPTDAYLCIPDIIRVAKEAGVDAIHPGYGFLSERADFAKACEDNGITFIGPKSNVVDSMGNKVQARVMAEAAGVACVPGTPTPVSTLPEAIEFCEKAGFPVMLKAAYGGGGRGMRATMSMDDLQENFERAVSEAETAFGNGEMFIEKLIIAPRHIEVQIVGDANGGCSHLFERDCSVQRRHQKVVEVAPAPYLDPSTRQNILDAAVRLCKSVGYSNAGTVEFLVDQEGNFYFIEVNARLQVEHTITEEITGVDLVQSQIRIASGESLDDLGLNQSNIVANGSAIQVRVTTEDPQNGFTPATGKILRYQTGEGFGVRIDSSTAGAGHVVTPYYDSLLGKVTARGRTHQETSARLARALAEFDIAGVTTNLEFLRRVLTDPAFTDAAVMTDYMERQHDLLFGTRREEAQKDKRQSDKLNLLQMLGDMAVNGPVTDLGTDLPPSKITAAVPGWTAEEADAPAPAHLNLKYVLEKEGPEGFAKAVRAHSGLLLTDTTWRDAHQSLLATRVRTKDLLAVAPQTSKLMGNLFSLENWGGATFDVSMRFLHECPWDRLGRMREAVPNIPFQMLLRGANALGYAVYPDNVVKESCRLAVSHGMDVFRVFDSLNYVPNMQLGMDAVHAAGGVVEAAISYSGDVSDPTRTKYNLDYYLALAHQLVDTGGVHVLCIKDMAGLLKPRAATILIGALRKEFPDMPIHVHTHDTSGNGVAAMLAAAEAGADVVDTAVDSMSGLTSQPSMGAIMAALANSPLDTGIPPLAQSRLSTYWEQCRLGYSAFEATTSLKSGSADVYQHEIPGGQYTNLHFQASALGLLEQWPEIKQKYAEANTALGDLIKVTPSSKAVGDLAQFMVQNNLSGEDIAAKAGELSFPGSVIDLLQGGMGQPYQGFPEWREAALKGGFKYEGRPGANLPPLNFSDLRTKLEDSFPKRAFSEAELVSAALYPTVFENFVKFGEKYGPGVQWLPTHAYFSPMVEGEDVVVEMPGGRLCTYKLVSIGEIDADSGMRELLFEVDGYPCFVMVEDKVKAMAMGLRERADPDNAGSVGAPMLGEVVSVRVREGKMVLKGTPVVVLSAMKMETVVTAPIDGMVTRIACKPGESLKAGELLLEISDPPSSLSDAPSSLSDPYDL